MKIKEFRNMSAFDLRNLCIRQNWFTKADNEEYSTFLEASGYCEKNITTDDLFKMAKVVERYSDIPDDMDTASIMYYLADICNTTFEIMEG